MSVMRSVSGAGEREELAAEIAAVLGSGAEWGVMIVGDAGMGKTALAQSVLTQLQRPTPIMRISGSSSLRAIPFGALAPYLHTLSIGDADSPVAIMRAVMAHLSTGQGDRSNQVPLLVIDDAHHIDESSSALLAQMISAQRAKVLLMVKDPSKAPEGLRALGTDGLLRRFDLQPLHPEEVRLFVSQLLGGPVLSGISRMLARATGGNPLFLRLVLEEGLARGNLMQRNGIWILSFDHPISDIRLSDLIRAELRLRKTEDIEALDIIALTEPVRLDALQRWTDADVIGQLQADGLIAVGQEPDRLVSFTPPIYGEVIRRYIPAARSMMLRGVIHDDPEPTERSPEVFLRTIRWGLECGAPLEQEELLRGSVIANRLRQHELAARAAHALSAPELRGPALVEIARAELGRGNVANAQELMSEALRHCSDFPSTKRGIQLSFDLKVMTGASSEDLRDDIDRWRSMITDLEELASGDTSAPVIEEALLVCRILECHVLIMQGCSDIVEVELRAILAHPAATQETHVGAMILLAELLGSMGRSVEGSTYSGEALSIIKAEGESLLDYRESAVARHVVVLTNTGRTEEAREILRSDDQTHSRGIVYLAGWEDFVDGIDALRATRNREACDRFVLAVEAIRESDTPQVLTLLLGLAAYAAALAGDYSRAEALRKEFDVSPERGSRAVSLKGQIFMVAAAALAGDSVSEHADLLGISAIAEKEGLHEAALTALRVLLMNGDTAALEPLIRVAKMCDGPDAEDLLAFAEAALSMDSTAMVRAATLAGEHGNAALEFTALTLSLDVLVETGAAREARTLERRLIELRSKREGPVPNPLISASPSARTPRLTPTERSIVALVRKGHSNRDIAVSKEVSVRTVEGHLYRVYAKLGVNRREELQGE